MAMEVVEVSSLDPVMLAVLKSRLERFADEMDATLFRSAFNPRLNLGRHSPSLIPV